MILRSNKSNHWSNALDSTTDPTPKEYGNKGMSLIEMRRLGLPVPNGFILKTSLCEYYYANNSMPSTFREDLYASIKELEHNVNKTFGAIDNPLLVSVRSGAACSMPGMMDTILNIGLNDQTFASIVKKDSRFGHDLYRRFIYSYGTIVLGIEAKLFTDAFQKIKDLYKIQKEQDIPGEGLKELIERYKEIVLFISGKPFPQSCNEQLLTSIEAVIKSWNSERALVYRELNSITSDAGTAVIVQSMVFGNMNNSSATGVVFTRNPINGSKKYFGEYLINAQGEDVVSGSITPMDLSNMANEMPDIYQQLTKSLILLEKYYKDLQDVEFTIENNTLWILQSRSGKRTINAALKIAVNMVEEGLINEKEALLIVDPNLLPQLLHQRLNKEGIDMIAKGIPASPGAAVGRIALDSEDVVKYSKDGAILIRFETSTDDINDMSNSSGIITICGGMTSHAAVVARGMGYPCIVGNSSITIDLKHKTVTIGNLVLKSGDCISIDGSDGSIYQDVVPMIPSEIPDEFHILMNWAKKYKKLGVLANADTSQDATQALKYGAEGIGLCRTEHMFFQQDRILLMRRIIVKPDSVALKKLKDVQKHDFIQLFDIMKDRPVTIRLLDPPLHEFLPKNTTEMAALAKELHLDDSQIESLITSMHEANPMLGTRGCRLGIMHPQIYDAQITAIFEAIIEFTDKHKISPNVEIMIPFIMNAKEMQIMSQKCKQIAKIIYPDGNIKYQVGAMIELPSAALGAKKIAEFSDFFSFGTNDLTQTALGLSRDDVVNMIQQYISHGLLKKDPFMSIDQDGVGELIKIACKNGKKHNKRMKLSICGEHAGDHESIAFFITCGINHISCSPYRISAAILTSAQAAIKMKAKGSF